MDRNVIAAIAVAAFALLTLVAMTTQRKTVDDCMFDLMRGQPQAMLGYALLVCADRHPGEKSKIFGRN